MAARSYCQASRYIALEYNRFAVELGITRVLPLRYWQTVLLWRMRQVVGRRIRLEGERAQVEAERRFSPFLEPEINHSPVRRNGKTVSFSSKIGAGAAMFPKNLAVRLQHGEGRVPRHDHELAHR